MVTIIIVSVAVAAVLTAASAIWPISATPVLVAVSCVGALCTSILVGMERGARKY